jgi:hypothetical protein
VQIRPFAFSLGLRRGIVQEHLLFALVNYRTPLPYDTLHMNIRSVRHRGLRRLIEDDDPRELRPDLEDYDCIRPN